MTSFLSKMRKKRRRLKNPPQQSTMRLFETLKKLGLSPRHVIDIGANKGDFSRLVRRAFPDCGITAFEPQSSLAEFHGDLMSDPMIQMHYKGVGDENGKATFTIHDRDDSSSFIYSSEEADARGYRQHEIEICTLDTEMQTTRFAQPDIIKIDAEGLDLKVLAGATKTLEGAEIVLVEAAVANPDYPNTALVVMQHMDGFGYRLFDITDLNRAPQSGVLWLIEAVFVRKGSSLDSASRHYV